MDHGASRRDIAISDDNLSSAKSRLRIEAHLIKGKAMKRMVSTGNVCGRHYVGVIEDGQQFRIGPFETAKEAQAKAAAECVRFGLPRAYVGIRRKV